MNREERQAQEINERCEIGELIAPELDAAQSMATAAGSA